MAGSVLINDIPRAAAPAGLPAMPPAAVTGANVGPWYSVNADGSRADMAGNVATSDISRAAAPAGTPAVSSAALTGAAVGPWTSTNAPVTSTADVTGAVAPDARPDQQVAVASRIGSITESADAESLQGVMHGSTRMCSVLVCNHALQTTHGIPTSTTVPKNYYCCYCTAAVATSTAAAATTTTTFATEWEVSVSDSGRKLAQLLCMHAAYMHTCIHSTYRMPYTYLRCLGGLPKSHACWLDNVTVAVRYTTSFCHHGACRQDLTYGEQV